MATNKRKREEEQEDDEARDTSPASAPSYHPSPPASRRSTRQRKLRRTESQDVAAQLEQYCAKRAAKKKICPQCGGKDSDTIAKASRLAEWVQCDACKQWWHAQCAEIYHDRFEVIEAGTDEGDFFCPRCTSSSLSS